MLASMLQVGRIRIHLLNDGFFAMDGGAMFGVVPKPLWSREVPPDAENRIPMSLHCPLAVDGRDVVLVDSGLGDRLSDRERATYKVERRGGLAARLGEVGIDPQDVTAVVLTHLHFDHLGGVVTRTAAGSLRLAFPRARLFVQRRELEAALHPGDERLAAAYRHAAECLRPVAEARLLEVLDGDSTITPRLRVVVTGGHTPSHQCPVLSDGGDTFIHMGDVVGMRSHLRPAWSQGYDLDPLGTIAAKKRILETAERERWWVSFDHDHEVACGRLAAGWSRNGALSESMPLA